MNGKCPYTFNKEFDSVQRESLWNIKTHGIPEKIIRVVGVLQNNFACFVDEGDSTD